MFNNFVLNSPLEQFTIVPIVSIYLSSLDFSITNSALYGILSCVLLFFFIKLFWVKNDTSLVPNNWHLVFEFLYKSLLRVVIDNVGTIGEKYFPIILSIFFFTLSINLTGLVPYSFTVTSHIIVVIFLAFSIFIGINIICFEKHGLRFFSLFYPQGTSLVLGFLLVPIELISYIFKPISLSIRLFANMMAGHTLLKVIAGFSWSLVSSKGILFLVHIVPLMVLVPLFGLELGVALIQSYVFTLLFCIYINDALNLH